jgi:hypothetical protein
MAQTGTRSPNHHPTGCSSSLAAADRKPVLVQLGDGMPTCRTAKSKGCPIVVQQSEEDARCRFGARPEKAMNMPISHIGLMYRSLGRGIVIGAARRRF